MKLSVEINGECLSIAEIKGKGHLGAHLNLDDKKGSNNPKIDIFISGYDTNDSKETKYLNWERADLDTGDIVKIKVMPEEKADPPNEVKSSLKDKKCFNITSEQADLIINASYACNERLNKLLNDLKKVLPESEYKKVAFGVGKNISEVFASLLEPAFRKHPDKVPESLKDMPL